MAEEINIDPPLTPQENKFDSMNMDMAKNSSANPGSSNSRICSNEKPNSAKARQHMIPHYLRASAGSCHDVCKYGRRREIEEMARKPLRKITAKPLPDKLKSTKMKLVSGKQTKEKIIKHKISLDYTKRRTKMCLSRQNTVSGRKPCLPNSLAEKSTSPNPPEIIKREIIVWPSKKFEASMKEGNSIDNKKLQPVKAKQPSYASYNSDGVRRRNDVVQTGQKVMPPATKSLVLPAVPLVPKFPLTKASESRRAARLRQLLSPLKNMRKRVRGVENEKSNDEGYVKTLHVIENDMLKSSRDDCAMSALRSPLSPNYLFHGKSPSSLCCRKEDEEISNGNEADEFVTDNILSLEIGNVKENQEKTLRMETENKHVTLSSPSTSHAKSSSSLLSHEDDDDEEIICSGDESYESITDNTTHGKLQYLKENHEKTKRIRALPSLSSLESSPHSKSPSLLSYEEDSEEITKCGIKTDEYVSGNSLSTVTSQTPKENRNKTRRKSRVALSEDNKYRSPVKLKFRSGKVLDLPPDNNNIPRRLRFRRARVSGDKTFDFNSNSNNNAREIDNTQAVKENQNRPLRKTKVVVPENKFYRSPVKLLRSEKPVVNNLQSNKNGIKRFGFRKARTFGVNEDGKGDLRRRNFRKGGGNYNAGFSELSSRKVVLRHRDVQGKKDARGLFNNVIEETASKLVESRKSKVKALVGAFETVISLQERKPLSRAIT